MNTGLFFGSFNPVHIGHLIIANHFIEFTDLEEVWFVVSPHNPLKEKNSLLDAELRLKMVQAAASYNKRFKASAAEFHLPQPSYTSNTLRFFLKKNPKRNFYILMGSDALEGIEHWKNFEFILNEFEILIYERRNFEAKKFRRKKNVHFFEFPFFDISATYLRKLFQDNKSLQFLMPEKSLGILKKNLTKI